MLEFGSKQHKNPDETAFRVETEHNNSGKTDLIVYPFSCPHYTCL